jgi:hypothetical protein
MTKPFHIFIFGLSIIVVLYLISLIVPEGYVNLGPLKIQFPSTSKKESSKDIKYKDISSIIKLGKTLDNQQIKKDIRIKTDTSHLLNNKIKDSITSATVKTDSIKELLQPLEFPKGDDTLLYSFFRQLNQLAANKTLIHILHYGDSQIEGDRITSYLRAQLQSRFGGEGIGLFPVVAVNPASVPYNYDISGNWIKYSPQDMPQKSPHNNYGALISYSRITSPTGLFAKSNNVEGWINLKQSNSTIIHTQRFSKCRIYYGTLNYPMLVELKQRDHIIDADIVKPSPGLNCLTWEFTKPEKDLVINFKSEQSPDIFGLSLTGNSGVVVDNIPLRGSSGLEFTRTNLQFMKEFMRLINVRLILMQFGINIVPTNATNYGFYERSFYNQLNFLKQANPGIQIIVIGVSDVAHATSNGFESYTNIEKVRDAQRKAAFEANCVFWDMFEAMGGKNSMPSWVNANPPLAQKDFTHLNPAGARIIGELFYRSLMNEYDKFSNVNKGL